MDELTMHFVYPAIDPESMPIHYTKHIDYMTRFGLHRKSDIAIQLAWRDKEIERLHAQIYELKEKLLTLPVKDATGEH